MRYVVCVVGMALLFVAPVVTTLLILRAPAGTWLALPMLYGTQVASRLASPVLPVLPMLPVVWGVGVIALQIRMIAAGGGVVGIGYWEMAVCGLEPADVARAIQHVVELWLAERSE